MFTRLCVISMFLIIGRNEVYASNKSKAEIGQYIAEFAINFA